MDRKEAYAQIKSLGLTEEVKKKFGKNFTQVTTDDLVAMIEENSKKNTSSKKASKPAAAAKKAEDVKTLRESMEKGDSCEERYKKIVTALAKFIASIPEEVLNDAANMAKTLTPEKEIKDISFSSAEIDKMFKG